MALSSRNGRPSAIARRVLERGTHSPRRTIEAVAAGLAVVVAGLALLGPPKWPSGVGAVVSTATPTARARPAASLRTVNVAAGVVDSGGFLELGGPSGGSNPWSPDGSLFVVGASMERNEFSPSLFHATGAPDGSAPGWCAWMTSGTYITCPADAVGTGIWHTLVRLDGKQLGAAMWSAWEFPDGEGNAVLCDDTGQCELKGWRSRNFVTALAMARGGSRVVVFDEQAGEIEVIETLGGKVLASLPDLGSARSSWEFSPDGTALAFAGADRLGLLNVGSGRAIALPVPAGASWGWTSDNRLLVADSTRRAVRAWNKSGFEVDAGLTYAPRLLFSWRGDVVGFDTLGSSHEIAFVTPGVRAVVDLPGPLIGDPWLSSDAKTVLLLAQEGPVAGNCDVVLVTLPS